MRFVFFISALLCLPRMLLAETITLGGTAQIDGRYFANDSAGSLKDNIIARRLRPSVTLRAEKLKLYFVPDLADGEAQVMDAYAEYEASHLVSLRVGKFKPPISLERLQSSGDLLFPERGLPANFVPNRDWGVQSSGDLPALKATYQLGIFQGNPDLSNANGDDDRNQDFVSRLMFSPDENISAGFGFSIGKREGSLQYPLLSDYRSPGQARIFRPLAGTYAQGTHLRLFPQATYYRGSFGSMAEIGFSSQEVANASGRARLQHHAWNIAASYVLTGEQASFKGVTPAQDFALENLKGGAWEVAARLGQIRFDEESFPLYASPARSVKQATAAGAGVNWYLNPAIKWQASYEFTTFDGSASAGQDRPSEHALFTRLQYQF